MGQIVWVAQGGFSVQHSCGTTKAHSPLGRASVCDLRQVPEISQDLVLTCPFLLGIRALARIKEMTLFCQENVKVEIDSSFSLVIHIYSRHIYSCLLYTPWRETLKS